MATVRRTATRSRRPLGSVPVARRDLAHPLVPTFAAVLIGAAYLVAAPDTADMAAHTYRTWLWNEVGFATWNAQWYGGHHWPATRCCTRRWRARGHALRRRRGGRRGVALFAVIARRIAPTRASAIARDVAVPRRRDQRRRDRADAVHARDLRSRSRRLGGLRRARAPRPGALVLAGASGASPVAGRVPRRGGGGRAVASRARRSARPVWRAQGRARARRPAVLGGLAMAALFPEGGSDQLRRARRSGRMLLVCVGTLALVDPTPPHGALGRRDRTRLRARARVRDPQPAGPNALRPGVDVRTGAARPRRHAPARAARAR